MKQFKSKKTKRKVSIYKIVIFIILILFFYYMFTKIFFNFKLANSNQQFLEYMLMDTNYHMLYEKSNHPIKSLVEKITNIDSIDILKTSFGYEYNEEDEEQQVGIKTEYVYDPNPTTIENPKVYIYNTHQLESYDDKNFSDFNIAPNILMASYMFKEKLNKLNIPTVIETSNITEFLNLNGWNYNQSYQASRFYVKDALNKYPNLELVIDLHRDAIPAASSTVTIDGKNYAKVLFVVGKEHDNYGSNLNLATKLNDLIKNKYPSLTRGITIKSGNNVNGIYNQDLSEKIILIELGGYENNIEEVMNTMEILSLIIKEYLKV